MGKKYNNAPILEAVSEFRPNQDSPWDLTVPGLIYEKVKDSFPKKEERVIQLIEQLSEKEQKIETTSRMQFLTENRKKLIQVGTRLLTINCLKPYPTWQEYKPMIEKAYDTLLGVTEVKGFQRIGLRYINLINIPEQSIKLRDYFEFRPNIAEELPKNVASLLMGCVFPFKEGKDLCKVELKTAVPENEGEASFVLDIDYYLAQPETIETGQAIDWVEEAHNEVEKVFESCITDKLRELFEEKK